MAITSNPVKRAAALRDRQLDFDDAAKVFEDPYRATIVDDRFEYGEKRYITAGYLDRRMVVIVWTARGDDHHVISMRHCHAKEERRWRRKIDQEIPPGVRQDAD
jgi:uncharacterized DUF497 family protein